ncbi:Alpha/Beta hydrolase protein [Hypoxylon rubiginosum]|uniref:Alpha/Beta hydrolase protein n=1 Tax=Hypoxylon rubiginosum TaxID=110542 RepID=A0ACC0D7E1_9PEZI|nr:Alpha/Beta hydrolase protein [Hypoxylon rubiginosum]
MVLTSVSNVKADGIDVFYRHAGPKDAPVILLLHGFPSSSFMFRNLIPLLAELGYRVIALDLPGYGFTEVPAERGYHYTFANFAKTTEAFLDALEIKRFAVYIFDYGAPTGLRVALDRPNDITAIITQNGNAYTEGFGEEFWAPIKKYWESGSVEDRDALRPFLTLDVTKGQYVNGSPHPSLIQPETYYLDQALMDRPGNKEVQLDMLYDYRTNVPLYTKFHEYFRSSGVPILAVWGKNDTIFIPPGAEAFRRDAKHFELHFLDAGHFALETNEIEMADLINKFLKRVA